MSPGGCRVNVPAFEFWGNLVRWCPYLRRSNLEGGEQEAVHDNVGIPPDGTGEVRVVGQPQPEVPEAIASEVCTKTSKEQRQIKRNYVRNAF